LKSSTLNPRLNNEVKADLRFQALAKQEMMEHQHIISGHHKEMQDLRDQVNHALERLNFIYDHSQRENEEKINALNASLEKAHARLKSAEEALEERKQTITALNQEIQHVKAEYTSQVQTESLKKYVNAQFNLYSTHHIDKFQNHQQDMKLLVNHLKEDLEITKKAVIRNLSEIDAKIESNFALCQMDKEGVLKEVRIYKKSMFIIEKKLEHIYALIEKFTGGLACHKQV
jgi:hypothetical protein